MAIFDAVKKNTTNTKCIIYTTQPPFPRQIKIMRKILTHGVTRNGNIGILSCITHEELKSEKEHIETKVTAKNTVLGDDKNVPYLLNMVCMIPNLYNRSVWLQKSGSGRKVEILLRCWDG